MISMRSAINQNLLKNSPNHKFEDRDVAEICKALIICDENVIKYYLDRGFDANCKLSDSHNLITFVINEASSERWINVVAMLIKYGVDVNYKDRKGIPLLSLLVSNGALDLVKLAVSHGADIEATDNSGATPVINAIHYKQIECLKYLLSLGADVNASTVDSNSALMWAAGRSNGIGMQKSYTCVKLLLEFGSDPNYKNKRGYTPLMAASLIREPNTVKILLKHGARIDETDHSNETALMKAAYCDAVEVVNELITGGANPNIINSDGYTALFNSVSLTVMKEIVKIGGDINHLSNSNDSILHIHMRNQNYDILEYLIKNCSHLNTKNNHGDTPIHIAVRSKNYEGFSLLMDVNVNISHQNTNGVTVLHDAILPSDYFHSYDIFNELTTPQLMSELVEYVNSSKEQTEFIINRILAEGMCPSTATKDGITPLMLAAASGNIAIFEILISSGANINSTDHSYRSALFYACKWGHRNIVNRLVYLGSEVNAEDSLGNLPIMYAALNSHIDIVLDIIIEFAFYVTSIKPFGT